MKAFCLQQGCQSMNCEHSHEYIASDCPLGFAVTLYTKNPTVQPFVHTQTATEKTCKQERLQQTSKKKVSRFAGIGHGTSVRFFEGEGVEGEKDKMQKAKHHQRDRPERVQHPNVIYQTRTPALQQGPCKILSHGGYALSNQSNLPKLKARQAKPLGSLCRPDKLLQP